LQPDRTTECSLVMRRCLHTPAPLARDHVRDHEVYRYPIRAEPRPWLTSQRIMMEARLHHRLLDEWIAAQCAQIDAEIAIFRGLSNRYRRTSGVQIDGLCSDDNHRVAMRVECNQGVEQHGTRTDQQVVTGASRTHASPSSRVGRALPRVRVPVR